jgi:hypothetical protein
MQDINDTSVCDRIKRFLYLDQKDYKASIVEYNGFKLLVIKLSECWNSPSHYTLNLKTFRPTKKSPNQRVLSQVLIEDLAKLIGDYFIEE